MHKQVCTSMLGIHVLALLHIQIEKGRHASELMNEFIEALAEKPCAGL